MIPVVDEEKAWKMRRPLILIENVWFPPPGFDWVGNDSISLKSMTSEEKNIVWWHLPDGMRVAIE